MHRAIENVPPATLAILTETVNRTRHLLAVPEADLRFMFECWNAYISPGANERISCGACRNKVVGRLRMYIQPPQADE